MNRNVVALALIAAGVVMSGCAAAAPIAASLGLAATSDSESRPDIEKDAIKSCDLFADHTKQIS
ncbi:MAG: hypothetical protein LBO72_06340, partial [Helicobacteraceae bacterium]|nr:hypothetical protein [Helicobacteraceae bacterium]